MAFVSETHLTVRYAETDMMGIVHHSRYYPWFEVARTDFIKKIGMSYTVEQDVLFEVTVDYTLTDEGLKAEMPVSAKYYYGLKYEDEVLVTCKMTKLTVARCEFTYEVYKLPEKKLMTVGKTGHGFVNREFVPINLKKLYPEIWNKMHDLLED